MLVVNGSFAVWGIGVQEGLSVLCTLWLCSSIVSGVQLRLSSVVVFFCFFCFFGFFFHFGVCTCSVQLSMSDMERRF